MKFYLSIFCLLFLFMVAEAQKKNAAFVYHIHRSSAPIVVDGVPGDQGWLDTDSADHFYMITPMDTSHATLQTVVRMTFDNENLYILAICYHPVKQHYMVESLKRDFSFPKNDNFIFFLDPFDARTDGFSFGANAAGAQWDGLMYAGGTVDLNWDTKWRSVVKNYPDRWVFEASIPFKNLRYKSGSGSWGVNFSRNDLPNSEKSGWAPVPRQFPSASLAYTGSLVWDELPPSPNTHISIIPYVLAGLSKDDQNRQPVQTKTEIGGDVKMSVGTSLNLDLTVNPDFSQVDVDQQVIDLSRYELFFPEKRQFFLENGDLFYNFGYSTIRPFFSRRIGLSSSIHYGGRLTGKLDKDWRIGIMDVQTGSSAANAEPKENFGVITLQRRVFSRSNIGFIFVNKQSGTIPGPNSAGIIAEPYNRNIGAEYNLASSNNLYTGKLLALKSFSPGKMQKDYVLASNLQYLSKFWTFSLQQEYIGRNFVAESGYVPRTAYIRIYPIVLRNFFPKSGDILSHGFQLSSSYYFNEAGKRTDNESIFSYIMTFRDRSLFTAMAINDYVQLLMPFDPTNTGLAYLPTGSIHRYNTLGAEFDSKPQSIFTFVIAASYGSYYDHGTKFSVNNQFGFRLQPFLNLAITNTFTSLSLPQPWGKSNFFLIGPKLDLTMTNTLYFTTYVQYNQQIKNENINLRLQWRYQPASDIFLVFSQNSVPSPFTVLNKQVVLKWTYWFN